MRHETSRKQGLAKLPVAQVRFIDEKYRNKIIDININNRLNRDEILDWFHELNHSQSLHPPVYWTVQYSECQFGYVEVWGQEAEVRMRFVPLGRNMYAVR
jgi:hypothetical protein